MSYSKPALAVMCLLFAIGAAGFQKAQVLGYDEKGRLLFPSRYRDWAYLSSGFNMSYTKRAASSSEPEHPVFDNVFADPASYQAFQRTGTWPDKTVLILEIRSGQTVGSINKGGHFQSAVTGVEAHVKDESRFPSKWAFFSFEGEKNGTLIPASASCYSCHAEHAAVDTTFVQFYPTLMPIAQQKSTLSAAFVAETGGPPSK